MDQPAAKRLSRYRQWPRRQEQRSTLRLARRIDAVMKQHGYSQLQELWQDLALSLIAADSEEQARRLKRPNASAFEITPKLSRQFDKASQAELKRDPGCEIEAPKPLPHGEQQCKAAQLDILQSTQ